MFQGGYHCSVRSVTQWEHPGAPHAAAAPGGGNGASTAGGADGGVVFDHPNYYSRYMDTKVEDDGETYTHWRRMEWPSVHAKTGPLMLVEPAWSDTNEELRGANNSRAEW